MGGVLQGMVEAWRPVPGAHGYEVSHLGRVRSRGKVLTGMKQPNGYI